MVFVCLLTEGSPIIYLPLKIVRTSNKKVLFSGSKIYVQPQVFDSLEESFSSGVKRFCHMIKLIKYHVTKRPGKSPEAHIQCRDSMSEPGNEIQ